MSNEPTIAEIESWTSDADRAYWEMEEFLADMENQEKIWAEETREAGIVAALAAGAPDRETAERWMEMA